MTRFREPVYVGDQDVLTASFYPGGFERTFYVHPSGNNRGGDRWENAYTTIQAAITASNRTINWSSTPKRYNLILVAPGVYAENLTPAYYCVIRGTGVRGTDTATEIHPATGSAITGTFLGLVLENLRIESNTASTPTLDIGICNNSRIVGCEFALGADVDGVAAIDTDNCTHLVVIDCDFTSGQGTHTFDYAFYHRGGSNKYAHNVRYIRNRMFTETAGVYIANTCTASQALIQENFIHGTGTSKGIYDLNGASFAVGNEIIIDGAGDAISHAGGAGHTLFNKTLVNGSYALETA